MENDNFCLFAYGSARYSAWFLAEVSTQKGGPGKTYWPCHSPTGTRRNKNVITTSKRRRFDVIRTLFLRRVSAGSKHAKWLREVDCWELHEIFQHTSPEFDDLIIRVPSDLLLVRKRIAGKWDLIRKTVQSGTGLKSVSTNECSLSHAFIFGVSTYSHFWQQQSVNMCVGRSGSSPFLPFM